MSEMDIPPRFRNKWDRIAYLADSYRLPITVLVVGLLVVAWRGGLPSITVPGWIHTLALGIAYGAIPSYLVGLYIVKEWFPDPRDEIIELNLTDDGRITAWSWLVPTEVWDNRVRGERSALKPDEGAKAIVTEMEYMEDVDKIQVEGCNEELANPVSITTRQGRLEMVEENLLDKAEDLDRLEATVRGRALDMQSENIHALLASIEEGTQMEPTAIAEAFDKDLLSFQQQTAEQRDRAKNGDGDEYPDPDLEDLHSRLEAEKND